jgi:flagellin
MKLTYNISAVIANNQLKSTETRLSKSIEKLSSGYKINKASDDPSGMAISQKLREQIKGLDNASQNSLDGVSVLQSADGALEEITSILQRVRELTVQSKNGTYTLEDKKNIQVEVDALTKEVDRLVTDTQFNGVALLDGSLSYKGYSDSPSVNVTAYSNNVAAQNYKLTVTQAPAKAIVMNPAAGTSTVNLTSPITAAQAGKITINGVAVEIAVGDTADQVYSKIRDGAKIGDVNLFAVTSTATPAATTYTDANKDSAGYTTTAFTNGSTSLLFVSEEYGSDTHVNISSDNAALLNELGIGALATGGAITQVGADAKVTLDSTSGFTSTATYTADGGKVTITDRNDFEMKVSVDGDMLSRVSASPATLSATVNIEATGMGSMILQVGALEDQSIDIMIPDLSVEALGIDNLNMLGSEGLTRSLSAVDNALAMVQSVRGMVGTYSNRLESASSSIDSTSFNLEEAYSRIMDTDMAEEMTNYTKENVLSQAGTSVLAQANEGPQKVLQLLA